VKKTFWLVTGLAIATFWLLPDSVTLPLMHLIILGIIPGTDIEMGLIFPLVTVVVATFFLVRWLSETAEALVEYKTEASHAEKRAIELQVAAQKRATTEAPDIQPVDAEEIDLQSI